jgi:hypothetical protein
MLRLSTYQRDVLRLYRKYKQINIYDRIYHIGSIVVFVAMMWYKFMYPEEFDKAARNMFESKQEQKEDDHTMWLLLFTATVN